MKLTKKLSILILFISTAAAISGLDVPPAELQAEIINQPADGYTVRVEYTFPEGYHQTFQQDFFKFEIINPADASIGEIQYPEGEADGDVINFYGKTVLQAELNNFTPGNNELIIKASWQLCDENGLCLFPESEEITAESNFTADTNTSAGFSSSIIFFLILAFFGGLLLNVMPCVLPVLSIKALSLVKQGGDNKKQILRSSLLYTAGVVLSLLSLAVVIIVIKASGEQVGWGFQFQNRGFVLALLTIIFVFALSLFEVFTISAPVMKTGSPMQKSGSAGSHFFSGVIAVLLATPCTAPFLGTAAGFAFSQSAPVILAVFFMVGLGLAFPFIIIGFIPAVVSKLPKPGSWMNTFREVMGFLLIGTSVWLIDVLIYQSAPGFLTRILIYLTALTIAAWLYGKLSSPGASKAKHLSGLFIAILIIASSAFILFANAEEQQTSIENYETSKYSSWLEFSPIAVNENIGGTNPVFVAFSAKWCMTCRTNESTVIFTDDISRFFEENNAVLIHGDYTNKNPEINDWMEGFGRAGVPFYAWYPPGSKDPVLLPEIISKKTITNLAK